jgi:hypothetical protein
MRLNGPSCLVILVVGVVGWAIALLLLYVAALIVKAVFT